jgi:hypothetical protein
MGSWGELTLAGPDGKVIVRWKCWPVHTMGTVPDTPLTVCLPSYSASWQSTRPGWCTLLQYVMKIYLSHGHDTSGHPTGTGQRYTRHLLGLNTVMNLLQEFLYIFQFHPPAPQCRVSIGHISSAS